MGNERALTPDGKKEEDPGRRCAGPGVELRAHPFHVQGARAREAPCALRPARATTFRRRTPLIGREPPPLHAGASAAPPRIRERGMCPSAGRSGRIGLVVSGLPADGPKWTPPALSRPSSVRVIATSGLRPFTEGFGNSVRKQLTKTAGSRQSRMPPLFPSQAQQEPVTSPKVNEGDRVLSTLDPNQATDKQMLSRPDRRDPNTS
jgi:hypothetical protein